MKIYSTKFKGLKIIKYNKYRDERGDVIKIFNKKNTIFKINCFESYLSFSKKGTVRGLHGQSGKYSQDKLIYCIKGKALDIAVDLRKNSKTFGKIFKKEINSKNIMGVFIPKGFAHGLIALENNTVIINFCSTKYESKKEFGINIKSLNIKLPHKKLLISKKDKNLPTLKNYLKENL